MSIRHLLSSAIVGHNAVSLRITVLITIEQDMKARVKATGKIVDVKFTTHPNPAVDEVYWWCKDNQKKYHKSELDFMGENIDWEQRRYEIAKDVFAAQISDVEYAENNSEQILAKYAVKYADALIEELKGGKK